MTNVNKNFELYYTSIAGVQFAYEAPKDAYSLTKGAYYIEMVVSVCLSCLVDIFAKAAKGLYIALTSSNTQETECFELEFNGEDGFDVEVNYLSPVLPLTGEKGSNFKAIWQNTLSMSSELYQKVKEKGEYALWDIKIAFEEFIMTLCPSKINLDEYPLI